VMQPERSIQKAIITYLRYHPRVAWAERMNVGAHKIETQSKSPRFVPYGFKGCSDIVGQLSTGQFLAIEVKSQYGRITTDQKAFLDKINDSGGLAFVARSIDDVVNSLIE